MTSPRIPGSAHDRADGSSRRGSEPAPHSRARLDLRTDRTLVRAAAHSRRWVLATVTAPDAPPRAQRLPVNVALVLDRSGSMDGERKFALAREAVEQALRMLHPDDRFSLVVYDTEIDVIARSTHATPAARREAIAALSEITPRGGTDLCGGWMRGCEQVAGFLSDDAVSRVLLLTDGLANHGITDADTLARHAHELRRRGVATSTFGVGEDFDERLLRDMAREGGGQFWFIERPAQIADFLTSELGEALEVVMRDVELRMALAHGVRAEPLNRLRSSRSRDGRELRVALGDLVSGQEVQVVVELSFPCGEIGGHVDLDVSLAGDEARTAHATASLRWTFASHADNDRQARDRVVDREVATQYASRARAEATEANRSGDLSRARHVISATVRRIRGYAGDDAALADIARRLEREMPAYADSPMSAYSLKSAVFAEEMVSRSRTMDGKARRR